MMMIIIISVDDLMVVIIVANAKIEIDPSFRCGGPNGLMISLCMIRS